MVPKELLEKQVMPVNEDLLVLLVVTAPKEIVVIKANKEPLARLEIKETAGNRVQLVGKD